MAKGKPFTRQHLELLLKLVTLLLPIATYEWEHLRTDFQSEFPEIPRTAETLKRKFYKLMEVDDNGELKKPYYYERAAPIEDQIKAKSRQTSGVQDNGEIESVASTTQSDDTQEHVNNLRNFYNNNIARSASVDQHDNVDDNVARGTSVARGRAPDGVDDDYHNDVMTQARNASRVRTIVDSND
jgi:hypothetical protein